MTSRVALAGLVLVCCLLAASYSVAVPAFEAPDEPGHYAYVEWLLDGRGIPLQGEEPPPLQPEFSQPPLYYLFEAPFAWLAGRQPANLPDWETRHNPFQNATDAGNVNLYFHSPGEVFPWSGALLGLHLMRLANVAFVALMILATYGCGLELGLPRTLAWCAAALVGLTPQMSFMGGALNADNAIGSISAVSLFLLLRWLNRPSLITAGLLGAALGGAALSKLSGLVAVTVALAFMALQLDRTRGQARRSLAGACVTAGAVAVVAGWWYVRNWISLGDPVGWNAMLPATGAMQRVTPLSFAEAALQLLGRWWTGLAVFGWANVQIHWAWYWAAAVLGGWALVGLVLAARKLARNRAWQLAHWLLLAWPAAFFVSLARWVEVNTAADQWRLLFPAYPAFALLAVIGLRQLLGQLGRALFEIPTVLLGLNIGSLALALSPAYAQRGPYTGPIEHPLEVRFGDNLQLVGYSTPRPPHPKPKEIVAVDFFWRISAPMSRDYAIDLALVDAQSRLSWKEISAPDEGRSPMTAWKPGELMRDSRHIRVAPDMVGAQALLLSVIDPQPPGNHLPATRDGQRAQNDAVTLGRFVVWPVGLAAPAEKDAITFQDHLQLSGHTIDQVGGQLRVTLDWKASGPAAKDYTVFVHMIAPDGKQVAQHDSQPGGGAFPTSLLGAGMEFPDPHLLDVTGLPAGDYRLEIGLYDLASGARVPTERGETSVSLPVRIATLPPVPLG
jgi:4-amino-4-deoxy-L-arabinose transferase-like glycosyltransferase